MLIERGIAKTWRTPEKLEVDPTSHTPALDVTAAAAPFRA
jgi:hypothetical protein